ncbi:MAG: TAXI family TRAP transporter solute-binding subunit [Rhodospirillaceae bacterium]|jgi:TRAP transporter TAXI family solute receptor
MKKLGFVVVGLAAMVISDQASAQAVGVGTGPQASLTNRIGAGVAKVMADAAGLKTRAVPHTSNAHHTPLVAKGTLAFGVNSTGDINDAIGGRNAYKGHPVSKDWVIAARLVPLQVGMLVRKSTPYQTLNDLKGKKIAVGFTAHKTVRTIMNAIYANTGTKESDFNGVPVPNTHGGTQLFLKGSIEATASSLGGARLRNADAKVGGLRVLKMNDSPEAVKAMQKHYPGSYLINRVGLGAEGKTPVMAFDMVLMTSTKISADVVYKAVKALHAGKKALEGISPAFKAFKPENMNLKLDGVAVHPGAIKFYKEMNVM